MQFLYKYPQRRVPLRPAHRREPRRGPRDAGVRAARHRRLRRDRYFDVFVEYAKADAGGHLRPDRGVQPRARAGRAARAAAPVVPQHAGRGARSRGPTPLITPSPAGPAASRWSPTRRTTTRSPNLPFDYRLGPRHLYAPADGAAAVHRQRDERRTRLRAAAHGAAATTSRTPSTATSIHGEDCVNPAGVGTKAARPLRADRAGRAAQSSSPAPDRPPRLAEPLGRRRCDRRRAPAEADEFYERSTRRRRRADERLIQRQALAGLLWTQADLPVRRQRLAATATTPTGRRRPAARRRSATCTGGTSTPCASCRCRTSGSTRGSPPGTSPSTPSPLALVDPEFAKEQLWLLLFEQFQHPNGQIPAYEWEFSDLNPPVHAWAVWRVYHMDRDQTGHRATATSWRSASTSC